MSTPVTAQSLGFSFIASLLLNDATLLAAAPGGVYRDLAPPKTAAPYVIVSQQAGSDVLTINAIRIWSDLVYQVKAVGPGAQYASIVAAASRIDALLKRVTNGALTGGIVLSCFRETPLAVSELIDGELWNNLGGLYRIAIQEV